MADFATAHEAFVRRHLARRKGERKGRLERGHRHAETEFLRNVWWPLMGNFDHLHPEFEVTDWRGHSYFADFAYLPPENLRLLIEIKGFNSHVRDMDRKKFCNELNRELFLQAIGYRLISLAYDDVAERPEQCQMLLRMFLDRFLPSRRTAQRAVFAEKELVRFAAGLPGPVRPIDVCRHFGVNPRTAVRMLHRLRDKGWLRPASGTRRVTGYELAVKNRADLMD